MSEISLIVCLNAQTMLSMNILNDAGGRLSSARSEWVTGKISVKQAQLTREAVKIDRSQQFEEPNTMFREFREVLIDHIQCRLEDSFEDWQHLWG